MCQLMADGFLTTCFGSPCLHQILCHPEATEAVLQSGTHHVSLCLAGLCRVQHSPGESKSSATPGKKHPKVK